MQPERVRELSIRILDNNLCSPVICNGEPGTNDACADRDACAVVIRRKKRWQCQLRGFRATAKNRGAEVEQSKTRAFPQNTIHLIERCSLCCRTGGYASDGAREAIFVVVGNRSTGAPRRGLACASVLCDRSRTCDGSELARVENGTLQEIAQAGGDSAACIHRRKHLRLQEQLLFGLLRVLD